MTARFSPRRRRIISLTALGVIVGVSTLLPVAVHLHSLTLPTESLWLLPLVSVAVLAYVFGWRGAVAAIVANAVIYGSVEFWPLRESYHSDAPVRGSFVALGLIRLGLSCAVAAATIRYSAAERMRRLSDEHLRAEEVSRTALAASEERYRTLVNSLGAGVLLQGRDGDLLAANASALRILGITQFDVGTRIPSPGTVLLHEDGTPLAPQEYPSAIARRTREPVVDLVIGIARVDQPLTWISVNAHPIIVPDEDIPERVVTSFTDVTAIKAAREQAAVQQALLTAQAEATVDGVLIVARDGRLVSMNSRFRELWQLPPEAATFTHADQITLLDWDRHSARIAAIDADPSFTGSMELLLADGRTFEEYTAPVRTTDGLPLGRIWRFRDITERRLVEQQLSDATERYRHLVEQIPAVVYTTGLVGAPSPAYISPRIEQLTGYPLSAFSATPDLLDRITHPEDLERKIAAIVAANVAYRALSIDYRLIHHDGHVIWVRDESDVITDTDGKPLFAQGVLIDVTARKATEHALQESEARFRASFDDAGSGVSITNLDGYFLRVNRAMCTMLGYDEHELIGKHFREITHPADQDRQATQGDRVAGGEISSFQMEKRYIHRDGHIIHGIVTVSAINGPDNTPVAVVSHVQDITHRRQVEEALHTSQERFRAAIEGSMDAFYILRSVRDAGGAIVDFEMADMNQRGAEFLSLQRDEAIGRRTRRLFPDSYAARFFETCVSVVEHGQPLEEEFADPIPGHAGTWLRHQIVPLADGLAITSRDITDERRAEQALRESEELFRAAAQGSIDAFFVARAVRDASGTIVDFDIADMNSRAEEFLRLDRDAAIGRRITEFFPAYRETGFFEKYMRVLESGQPFEEELRDPTPGFEGAWMHHQIVPLADGVAITSRDITDRMQIENALRESEERFRSAFANAVTGMARVAPDGRFLEVNTAFLATFGFSEEALRHRTLDDLAHPDDRAALAEHLHRLTSGATQATQFEGRYVDHQQHMLWGLLGASVVHAGDAPYLICQIQDITARKEQEQRLLRQAQHDALTSLPNRLLFMERLDHALATAAQRESSIAVMYLDLDGFKTVNDTLGHLVGDQLLAEVGNRLTRCIRSGDTVARLGGDEFAIIAEGVLSEDTATRIAGRIIDEFARSFNVGGRAVDVGVSIGIAFSAPGHANPDALLHEADVALYQAKAAGKRRFLVYSRDLTPEQEDQLLAERTTDLRPPENRSES